VSTIRVYVRFNRGAWSVSLVKEIYNSNTLVIAATGYGNKLNLKVNLFFKKSGLNNSSKIVITDKSKLQTLGGLPPGFPTFFDLLDYLQEQISKIPHNQLIITGTSGGAHTALLLGHLLKADEVVAFSPYPYLSIKELKRMGDPALQSMWRVVEKLDALPVQVKNLFDLMNTLSNWNKVTQYYVHISRYNSWDYRRAMYLSSLPNVSVIPHPYKEHAIASMLSHDDKLAACFVSPYKNKFYLRDIIRHLANLPRQLARRMLRGV